MEAVAGDVSVVVEDATDVVVPTSVVVVSAVDVSVIVVV